MKILKPKEIETNSDDDFLYEQLLRLFERIKLVQGGTNLDYSLKHHLKLRNYAIAKQIALIKEIELKYFNEDGSLKSLAITAHNSKNNIVHF